MPDKIELCAEIRRLSPVPIATGEHEYTRWGQRRSSTPVPADVLQPELLGRRSLRDGEDLRPRLDLRYPGDRPRPLRAGKHASDDGHAGAAVLRWSSTS